jgi:uncharacterized protein (UPF0333 family)
MEKFLKLPLQVRIAIIIVVSIIVIIIFINIKNYIKKLMNRGDETSREAKMNYNEAFLSYSNLEYKNMAERMYQAMLGPGTNTSTIYEILGRLNNADDWYKLVSTFGVKESTYTYLLTLSKFSGNLIEWLTDELSANEQKKVSGILANIGVTF